MGALTLTQEGIQVSAKTAKTRCSPCEVEVGPPNLAGQRFYQYKLHKYSLSFHLVLLFITGKIHLLCSVAQLRHSLLIPGAGAAEPVTQCVPQAGKLQ